ncbi:MAG: hypothetical protein ACOYBW_08935 [Fluviibacter phosphoraccumulans]
MTRIKTVYAADMVCHLWANGHAHDVRTPTDNLFTKNGVLFSYGPHYAIGAHVKNGKGDTLILWNTRGYSSTTAQHTAKAWRALSVAQSRAVVRVPVLNRDTVGDFPGLAFACLMQAREPLQACEKARERLPVYIQHAARLLDDARRLYEFAGDKKRAALVPVLAPDAGKPEAALILADMTRADNLETGKKESERAGQSLQLAQLMESEAGRYTARGIAREIVRTVEHVRKARAAFEKAGKKAPRELVTIEKTARALGDKFAPLAHAEELQQMRIDIAGRVRATVQELAEYRRIRKAGKFNRAVLWAVDKLKTEYPPKYSDEKQARAIWGKDGPQMREYINSLITRGDRIGAFDTLARAVQTVGESVTAYTARPDIQPVPRGDYLARAVKTCGGTLPAYWAAKVNPLLSEVAKIESEHAARVLARNLEKIEQWRAGESVTLPRDVGPLVRIVGDTVATSWGAVVPLEHAARLLKLARAIQARGGQRFEHGDGPAVGFFRVSSIGADFRIVIGCHEFTPDESEHAARLIIAATSTTSTN